MKKIIIGVLAAFVLVSTPALTQAATVAELQAMIAQLTARLNTLDTSQNQTTATTATTATTVTFTRNLTVGSSGSDVTALQNFLVYKGFLPNENSSASGYFGPQTRAALAAYQVSKGISPADGFFGPIVRAAVQADLNIATVVTTVSGGSVSVVDKPSLKLSLNNGDEVSLSGSAKVNVTAGDKDLLINFLQLQISDSDGKVVFTNMHQQDFKGTKNTIKEIIAGPYQTQIGVWRVKAKTTATFEVSVSENPKVMFAGIYKAFFGNVGYLDSNLNTNYSSVNVNQNSYSNSVTIVGEKSPYISGRDLTSDTVILSGVRFTKNDRVYINGVYKGILNNVKLADSSYAKNLTTYQGSFPISWLDVTSTGKGGCPVYGNVQIEDPNNGKSNNIYVSKDCSVTATPASVVTGSELSQANLVLTYNAPSKESGLLARQSFSVTAGNQDVYVVSAGFKLSKNGVVSSKWIPNGTTYTLGGTGVNTQSFTDNNGNINNGWLVKAGQTAKFGASMSMNPQLMYSGVYSAELSGVQVYTSDAWQNAALYGNSMPSNSVTIVGENANPTTPMINLTSSPVASDKAFPYPTVYAPNIESVGAKAEPASSFYPGEQVTIVGSNFPQNPTIMIGSMAVSGQTNSSGQNINFIAPTLPAGNYNLSLAVKGGSNTVQVTVMVPVQIPSTQPTPTVSISSVTSPSITSLSSTSGPIGSNVTVYGSGFDDSSYVSLGGGSMYSLTNIVPSSISANSLVFTVPSVSVGTNFNGGGLPLSGNYTIQIMKGPKGYLVWSNPLNFIVTNQTQPTTVTATILSIPKKITPVKTTVAVPASSSPTQGFQDFGEGLVLKDSTASLTVNGSHSATVKPGDSVTYVWNATNADVYTSSFTSNSSSCGSSNTWVANTTNGTGTYTIPPEQSGCTYNITYTSARSNGYGPKASDTVTVSVVSPTSSITPSTQTASAYSAVQSILDQIYQRLLLLK